MAEDTNLKWNGIDLDDVFVRADDEYLIPANFNVYGLWNWGINAQGQLGNPALKNASRSSPVQVGTLTNWKQISAGTSFTVSTKIDGTLWSWGDNFYGQLGQNTATTVDRSSPVQIGIGTDWKYVRAGAEYVLSIKTNGTLWSWGRNDTGWLGQNDIIWRSSPVQLGTDTDWKEVAAGADHSLAIKTNGTLWSWGDNSVYGQLGHNDRISRSSPVQVGTDTDWKYVWAGIDCTAALKTNGTLWTWGINNDGQLGHNDRTIRSSPVQVGADTDWKNIIITGHVLAIKTNGTLWSWGDNNNGELGFNNVVDRSSPVQLGTDTDWKEITAGASHSLAIKTNGTLWSWGNNSNGELGQNIASTVSRSSPVQVGTVTTWRKISAPVQGSAHTIATRS